MGAACEHFLYDKGYGPTNLTLKEYLHGLFPEARPTAVPAVQEFPLIEHTLMRCGVAAEEIDFVSDTADHAGAAGSDFRISATSLRLHSGGLAAGSE